MNALGQATLGIQCLDKALGMATLGVFCGTITIHAPQPYRSPFGRLDKDDEELLEIIILAVTEDML